VDTPLPSVAAYADEGRLEQSGHAGAVVGHFPQEGVGGGGGGLT
jgi:hypothetical protein